LVLWRGDAGSCGVVESMVSNSIEETRDATNDHLKMLRRKNELCGKKIILVDIFFVEFYALAAEMKKRRPLNNNCMNTIHSNSK
jgi:hypothetical protein